MSDDAARAGLVERAAWSLVWLAVVAAGVSAWGDWSDWPGVAVVSPLIVLLGLVGGAALWAVGDGSAALMRRLALGASVAAVALTDGLDIAARHSYSTDSAAFNDVATTLLLHGRDPYASSLASAGRLLHAAATHWTYLVNGGHVTGVSYPAGSFLLQAPFVALGLHHLPTDWVDLAAWIATILLLNRVLPTSVRWLAPLLLLSGAFVTSFANGGTDALFLPFLALAVWRWDRFDDPARARWARWLSPLALGVACSVKQSPWLCLPFLLLGVAAEARARGLSAARSALRYGALAAGAFLAVNLPFIAWGPRAWWRGAMLPLLSPLVPDGQGLVTLALHGATGGANVHELWLAAGLVALALAAGMALAYPVMKRAWLFLVPVVLFVPGRSLSSYLLDFFPVALAAAVSVRPAPPGAGWRVDRRVAGAAVGAPLAAAVAASAWALTSAPLALRVLRVATTARHAAITSITLRVTNLGGRPVAPHFMFTIDGGHPSGFWVVRAGAGAIAPHASATVTIAPPTYFWAPFRDEFWLVTAYTASPAGVSTTGPSRWRYGPR